MQGTILSVASPNGKGLILSDNGERYTYALADWRNLVLSASPGMRVDFEVSGSLAMSVYPLPEAAPPPAQPSSAAPGGAQVHSPQPPTRPSSAVPGGNPVPPPSPPASVTSSPRYAPHHQPAYPVKTNLIEELLHLYFNPSGRINRSTFWLKGVLLLALIWFVIYLLEIFVLAWAAFDVIPSWLIESSFDDPSWTIEMMAAYFVPLLVIHIILSLIHAWTNFAVTIKRLHDTDRSGWWTLAWGVAYIVGSLTTGIIIGIFIILGVIIWALVWLGFQEGTLGRNRYGQATTGPEAGRTHP